MTEQDLNMFEQRASTEEASSSKDVKALVNEVRRLHKVVGVNPPVGHWEPKDNHLLAAEVAAKNKHEIEAKEAKEAEDKKHKGKK